MRGLATLPKSPRLLVRNDLEQLRPDLHDECLLVRAAESATEKAWIKKATGSVQHVHQEKQSPESLASPLMPFAVSVDRTPRRSEWDRH